MKALYTFGIRAYGILLRAASLANSKAKLWVNGRKKLIINLPERDPSQKCIWIHTASLGEFEQGRPIIEAIKDVNPDIHIHLTFFSPSGYEVRKGYGKADSIGYLPLDTTSNAKAFVQKLKPDLAIFVKYEYWYNHIDELHKNSIPLIMVSAIFRSKQVFFKPYGFWFRKQLGKISYFFLQNDGKSEELLSSIKGIKGMEVAGDTRFDRVYQLAQNPKSFPEIATFAQGMPMMIAGSTWPKDEELLAKAFQIQQKHCKLVIAPHEIHEGHLQAIEECFYNFKTVRHSKLTNDNQDAQVLIIDSIGKLMHLYQYGSWAYIGGGFGKGIHNILEASTFGLPTLFGPNYTKFNEAVGLIAQGGAFSIQDEFQLKEKWKELIQNLEFSTKISEKCLQYTQQQRGAVEAIIASHFVHNLTTR